jgi:penicillin-binding protein 2A
VNYINFHPSIQGISLASKIYFGKDLKKQKLEPDEVAILASQPKSPTGYYPLDPKPEIKKKALDRRNLVLGIMARTDEMQPLISQADKSKYQQMDMEKRVENHYAEFVKPKNTNEAYLQLVQSEIGKLIDDGKLDSEVLKHGATIHTNYEPKMQQAVDKAMSKKELFVSKQGKMIDPKLMDAGVTVMKPDGAVVAISGGREYLKGYSNRALERHQPGSSIKPLSVYTPAIEDLGYHEYTPIVDKEVSVRGKKIKNYTGNYAGKIQMWQNVKDSLNASTVEMLQKVGLERSFNYTKKLGLELVNADLDYSPLALGGLTRGASTLEMAQAYTVYPQSDGKVKEAFTIKKVDDPLEKDYERETEGQEVFSEKSAYYMTRMLEEL